MFLFVVCSHVPSVTRQKMKVLCFIHKLLKKYWSCCLPKKLLNDVPSISLVHETIPGPLHPAFKFICTSFPNPDFFTCLYRIHSSLKSNYVFVWLLIRPWSAAHADWASLVWEVLLARLVKKKSNTAPLIWKLNSFNPLFNMGHVSQCAL